MEIGIVNNFFEKNAESWIANGYYDDGYNYPVGYHRMRIIKKILASYKKNLKIVDLGCGGGNISFSLASEGHEVVGVDQSNSMIEICKCVLKEQEINIQNNVKFYNRSIFDNGLEEEKYDIVIAMGVIGYLDDDDILFNEIKRLLKPGGVFLVSCRNRLFNMQSVTHRTINEINNGKSINLINELSSLSKQVPISTVNSMVKKLKTIAKEIPEHLSYDKGNMKKPAEKRANNPSYKIELDPRQHTPKDLENNAINHKLSIKSFHGVHPHLINPEVNKLLPPKIFNMMSSILEPLEEHPVSLTWSSVFIAEIQKK